MREPLPDLDYLRTLLVVARRGSMSEASGELLLSQSAISIQIAKLEDRFGHRLLDRHARGVTLTRQGRVVADHAEQMLRLCHELNEKLRGEALPASVRLGLAPDFALGRLPKLLREFSDVRRHLTMRVVVSHSPKLEDLLKKGALDLALAATEFTTLKPLVRWRETYQWVAGADFQLDLSRPLPLVMIVGEEDDSLISWEQRILERLQDRGLRWTIAYGTDTVESKVAAIEAGLGIGNLVRDAHRPAMRVLTEFDGLPPPPDLEFGIFARTGELSTLEDTLVKALLSMLHAARADG